MKEQLEMKLATKMVEVSESAKSKKIAEDLGVTEDRAYATPEEMVAAELKREDKIDFVVICTPNCYHYRCIICTDTYIYRPSYLKGSKSIIP